MTRIFILTITAALILTVSSCFRYEQYEAPWTEPDTTTPPPRVCNGDPQLCERKFSQVVFPTTHNSFNYEIGFHQFNLPNQDFDVARQLKDGIRGFMLDVYDSGGELVCYHTNSLLGQEPLSLILGHFKKFFDEDSTSVVSIIFETDVTGAQIQAALEDAGLMELVYTHPANTDWPTLRKMIDDGTRLVIFTENADQGGNPAWFHYAWGEIVDTPYDYTSSSEFSCEVNRGNEKNPLFLVNHWVSLPLIGTGSKDSAKAVNAYEVLYPRVLGCMNSHERVANFVAVDFYKQGDLFRVVQDLNNIIQP